MAMELMLAGTWLAGVIISGITDGVGPFHVHVSKAALAQACRVSAAIVCFW
jgi:hypothetical protein